MLAKKKNGSIPFKPSQIPNPVVISEDEEDEVMNPVEFLMAAEQTKELEDRGIIFINNVIAKPTLERAISKILNLHYNKEFNDEVQIILNSPGGFTDAGWALIDIMGWVRMPIRTIAVGEIASMATMIFIAGDKRIMAPNSTAMLHHFMTSSEGSYPDLVASRKHEDAEYNKFIRHLIAHSKYRTEKQINDNLLGDSDHWFSPQEMKKHGLCDQISKPRKKK